MHTYIPKKSKFKAVQFTGDNRDEVLSALGVSREYCSLWRNDDTKECYLVVDAPGVHIGKITPKTWIVVGASSYSLCSDDIFQQDYEFLRRNDL